MSRRLHFEEVATDYYHWICRALHVEDQEGESYWLLMKDLHRKEFYWSIHNDDNRIGDAHQLREMYMDSEGVDVIGFVEHSVSVLEVLFGLAHRIKYMMDDLTTSGVTSEGAPDASEWFWHLIRNLDLWQFTDAEYAKPGAHKHVLRILDRWLDRTYDKDGHGGLFPLTDPEKDQRSVELWYQMSEYVVQNYY